MQIFCMTTGAIATNTYFVVDDGTRFAAIVDPAANAEEILRFVRKKELRVERILLTHGHFDHIGAVDALSVALSVPVAIASQDVELLSDAEKNVSLLFSSQAVTVNSKVQTLCEGDHICIGSIDLSVMATPGHTCGSVCFFAHEDGVCRNVLTGDTLFADGEGRTDLYGGDAATLRRSLEKLRPCLSGKTIYPGHGPSRRFF